MTFLNRTGGWRQPWPQPLARGWWGALLRAAAAAGTGMKQLWLRLSASPALLQHRILPDICGSSFDQCFFSFFLTVRLIATCMQTISA